MLEPIRAKVQCSQAAVGKFSDKCLKVPYLHKVYWTNYQIQLASRLMVEAKLSCEWDWCLPDL